MASSEDWIAGYRIVAPRWEASAFSGDGAAKYGGRWNSPGRRVVYVAGSRALAALEMLVHLTAPGSRAKPYLIFEVLFPAASLVAAATTGPSIETGNAWLQTGRSLALRIPSVIIPEESNFALNPAHADIERIRIGPPKPFRFDQRL